MARTVAKTKIKKKKWVEVLAPVIFNNKSLGESYVTEADVLVGRHISANMLNVTGEPKKQNIILHFQVKEIKDGKAQTFTRGFELTNSSLKRFIRRGREKVDDSFRVKTKDDLTVRIKPLAITKNNTSNSVVTKIRNTMRQLVAQDFSKQTFSELVQSILRYDFQRGIKDKLGKIYPVRNFEIRVLKLLDEDKVPEEKLVVRERKPKVEKPVTEEVKEEKPADDKKEEKKEEVKEEKTTKKTEKKETKKEEKVEEVKEEKPKKTTKKTASKKDDKK